MDVGDEGEGFGEAKFREGGVSTHATFIARLGKARVNRVVPVVEVASKALAIREAELLKGRQRPSWSGKRILLVDDGIATGATMEVAIRTINAQRPASLTVAVPVAALSAVERLHRRIDHVFALHSPSILGSVGEFYEEFPQVTEEEVTMMIDQLERRSHGLAARS